MFVNYPKVSFVIPTYNSARTIGECIESIKSQSYPSSKIEIIVVDGGSTDGTLDISKAHGVTLIENPSRIQEGPNGGKAIGIKAASGEYICLVDSDNVLGSKNWLQQMLIPLMKRKDIGMSECGRVLVDSRDPPINRYLSKLGCDPVTFYIADTPNVSERYPNYDLIQIKDSSHPTVASNGVIIRREVFIKSRGYTYDTNLLMNCKQAGYVAYARVNNVGLYHRYVDSLSTFCRKKLKYLSLFSIFWARRESLVMKYLIEKRRRKRVLLFVLSSLTMLIPLHFAGSRISEERDLVWLYHPIFTFISCLVYFLGIMLQIRKWLPLLAAKKNRP